MTWLARTWAQGFAAQIQLFRQWRNPNAAYRHEKEFRQTRIQVAKSTMTWSNVPSAFRWFPCRRELREQFGNFVFALLVEANYGRSPSSSITFLLALSSPSLVDLKLYLSFLSFLRLAIPL